MPLADLARKYVAKKRADAVFVDAACANLWSPCAFLLSKGIRPPRLACLEVCRRGYTSLCELMLQHGMDPTTDSGFFREAALHGHREICHLLIDYGASAMKNNDAFYDAIRHEHESICRLILAHNMIQFCMRGFIFFLPFRLVIEHGSFHLFKMLYESVIPRHSTHPRLMYRLLEIAVRNNRTRICEYIIEAMDEDFVRQADEKLFDWPIHQGHLDMCRLLMTRKFPHKKAILHQAAMHGHAEICKLFLDQGVDWNTRDIQGDTPLHDAAQNGHLDVCRVLLEAGADMYANNAFRECPVYVAASCEHDDILRMFIRRAKRKFGFFTIPKNRFGYSLLWDIYRRSSRYTDSSVQLIKILYQEGDRTTPLNKTQFIKELTVDQVIFLNPHLPWLKRVKSFRPEKMEDFAKQIILTKDGTEVANGLSTSLPIHNEDVDDDKVDVYFASSISCTIEENDLKSSRQWQTTSERIRTANLAGFEIRRMLREGARIDRARADDHDRVVPHSRLAALPWTCRAHVIRYLIGVCTNELLEA